MLSVVRIIAVISTFIDNYERYQKTKSFGRTNRQKLESENVRNQLFLAHAGQTEPTRLSPSARSSVGALTDHASDLGVNGAVLLEPALAVVVDLRERRLQAHRGSRCQLAKFPLHGDPGWIP